MATERLYFSSDEALSIEKNAYDVENIERHESRYHFAAKQLTAEMNILDCACGSGYGSDILKDSCTKVTGIDIDPHAVGFAKAKYSSDKLEFLCGDIRIISDDINQVDAVVCLETLEHVPDPRILLDGFMKVLKVDGTFVVSTPVRELSRENPLNSFHTLEYTHADLKRLLNHYFYHVDIYLQDQDKFYRIDDEIHWGFVVAVCKYPKNKVIDDLNLLIKDKETKNMIQDKRDSFISETASVSDSVTFKPSFEDGVYHIMDHVEIRDNTIIETHNNGKLTIGEKTVIGYNCWVNATGDIDIGSHTLIGANSIITSSSHHFKDNTPISEQGMSFKKVSIGSNVWIGSNVSILEGVTIGDNCVVGANCIVKNDLAPNSVLKANSELALERMKKNKAVFYLLPFTIRNDALTFQCIYDRYKELAQSFLDKNWDVLFVSTDELSENISKDGWEVYSPKTFSIEYDEKAWFSRWNKILNDDEDAVHNKLVDEVLSSSNPEIVFCWNYDGILKKKCRENNIKVYFNELGLSRNPNPMVYYSDPNGVNNRSSLKDFWEEFNDFELSEEELTIARLTQGKIRKNYNLNDAKRNEIISNLSLAPNKKITLIILQVENDSNIVAGSVFTTMQQFFDLCIKKSSDDVQFIVKTHPAQQDCNIIAGNITVVTDQFTTMDLIAISDCIYTINSSAGFEALIAGKKVVIFGTAPYSIPELTYTYEHEHEHEQVNKIADYLALESNSRKLLKLVYLTYHQYFFSEQKFFDAEFHIRRHLLNQSANETTLSYFFDSGSYYKNREIQVNQFQNKVLQDAILGYEKWIESLKQTEKNAMEISEWAKSLNEKNQVLEFRLHEYQEQHELFLFKIAAKLTKKSLKNEG